MRAEPGAEPRPDAELLRVLQAAASAAQQSQPQADRRRHRAGRHRRRRQEPGRRPAEGARHDLRGGHPRPAAGQYEGAAEAPRQGRRCRQRAGEGIRRARPRPTPGRQPAAPDAAVGRVPVTEPASPTPQPMASAVGRRDSGGGAGPHPEARGRHGQDAAGNRPRGAGRHAPEQPTVRAALAMDTDLPLEPVDPVQTKSLTAAIEAAMATVARARRRSRSLPPTGRAAAPSRPSRRGRPRCAPRAGCGPAGAGSLDATAGAAAAAGTGTAAAARRLAPSRRRRRSRRGRCSPTRALGARRCRHARRRRPGAAAARPFPTGPARAPWPEPGEPAPARGLRSPTAATPSRRRRLRRPSGPTWRRTAQRRAEPQGEKGLLIEAVPRRMRVGVPATAEVRIARDKVDGLLRRSTAATRIASADAYPRHARCRCGCRRRRAASGSSPPRRRRSGSTARPAASRTTTSTWRWTVVPHRRGRGRLTLMVSARTIRPGRARGRVVTARSRDRREDRAPITFGGLPVDGVDRDGAGGRRNCALRPGLALRLGRDQADARDLV